jgi:3-methyladenine DNA glycosylase AlkC
MAEKLKDLFFADAFLQQLADAIEGVHPAFDRERFARLVYGGTWDDLALKAKMHHITGALHETLPQAFPAALEVLTAIAPSFRGFDSLVFPDYVASYGQEHWELSMPALAFFTPLCSSEYAVRPFIDRDPERAMAYLREWADHENAHVRRLASEGCRPRLPWGMGLAAFKKDPSPILPVLEKLKDDESEYVRKSVANNLNDISKDHPDLVLDVCERWYGNTKNTDWIVRHACRGLLKAGNRRALLLFGFADPTHIRVENLTLDRETLAIGEVLRYTFELTVDTQESCRVRVELAVQYARAKGKMSRKVFAIREGGFDPGSYSISRKLSLADQSTRKHHAGEHAISIIVNGVEMARASFELTGRSEQDQ